MGTGEGPAPYFAVREGYAFYRGPLTDGSLHRHAAFQVAVAVEGEVTIVDASGVGHRGAAVVVPPMVRHRTAPVPAVLTYFVDPHCAFADRLRAWCGEGITVVPELRDLDERDVRRAGALRSGELDPRLRAAVEALTRSSVPLPVLAAQIGLSPQRLRALAGQQLGMPLARWRIWRRLVRAAGALREGQSLAEAALTGGFADQAHFSRQMREMTGLTPSAVLPLLRGSGAAGDMDGDRTGDRRHDLGLTHAGEPGPGHQTGEDAVSVGLGVLLAVRHLHGAEGQSHDPRSPTSPPPRSPPTASIRIGEAPATGPHLA
ncbi:hypothetical protein KNE206_48200 [Kitasatospora sp. NE20-6]|uniref:helix-turn-helix domain-containing protein n=1 Tax=Kitasatospora sp. NE20-6 TaxID=2859066 RepID=UPI0034DC2F09